MGEKESFVPCPHCGYEPEFYKAFVRWRVTCSANCGFGILLSEKTRQDAIGAWQCMALFADDEN